MELNTKQKVLLAIYTEYQKDIPNMEQITNKALGLPLDAFKIAVDKLQSEGFIKGAQIIPDGNSNIPAMVIIDSVKMTHFGIEYIEQKIGIERTLTGEQKVKNVLQRAAEWGWEQIKDIAAKTLSEMAKSS